MTEVQRLQKTQEISNKMLDVALDISRGIWYMSDKELDALRQSWDALVLLHNNNKTIKEGNLDENYT
ncbi:hypothetical protein [Paenibacillus sp. y28]|uniref:hypothetical protein n=1 Tax=Paenibacillus sp. y28 TaxID=3129110 RepID=UPI0030176237